MTQEQKELLFKDLCARLLFGVKVRYSSYKEFITCTLQSINPVYDNVYLWSEKACFSPVSISKIRPYLFPMSSMTEEEFTKLKEYSGLKYDQLDLASFQNGTYKCLNFYLSEVPSGAVIRVFDWLNTYHFDYRDLIQMGLAIDATNLNIY